MIRIGSRLWVSAALALLVSIPCFGEETNTTPDFSEVYDLVRAHLPGASDAELNSNAVQAFISALAPKVSLASAGSPPEETTGKALVSKAALLEDMAYLRIGRVDEGLDEALRAAYQHLVDTNKIKGLVLDLRFTGGAEYAAATAAADLFVKDERALLNWGDGLKRSHEKEGAITCPVAVLVNGRTAAGAEALAAMMRETGAGLILGARTAGEAAIAQEYPLKNGQRLRIATDRIRLGTGGSLSAQGLQPDITVEVSADDERKYFDDAYAQLTRTNPASMTATNQAGLTNRPARRPRFNEAELVRERKAGTNAESDLEAERDTEPEKPFIHDPTLARALDLLKGLAVVRQSRSATER